MCLCCLVAGLHYDLVVVVVNVLCDHYAVYLYHVLFNSSMLSALGRVDIVLSNHGLCETNKTEISHRTVVSIWDYYQQQCVYSLLSKY